jgi:FtsH-binding integral membrane protein
MTINPRVRALLPLLLFLVAWWLGTASLIAGFEMEAGVPAACIFAFACLLWWTSYKMSRSSNGKGMTLGLMAIGLWMLHLIGALVFDFHHTVAQAFFWTSTVIFALLIVAVALSDTPSGGPRAPPIPRTSGPSPD